MLQLFRDNQIFNGLLVLPYLLVMCLNNWFFPTNIDFADSINGSLTSWMSVFINNQQLQFLSMLLLLLIQAYIFNALINFFKLARSQTYISAVCYIILHFVCFDMDVYNPALVANTFLLLALYSLFASYDKKVSMATVFNVGFYLGISVLCYHSYIVFFYWALFGFFIVRSFDFRELLILISGFFVPLFLMGTYQFLQDNLNIWLQQDIWRHYGPVASGFELGLQVYLILACFVCIYLVAVVQMKNIYFKTSAKEKKFVNCLYIMPIFACLSFLWQQDLYHFHFTIFIIAMAALLSLSLHSFKSQLAVEGIHFVLFMTCLGIQYQELFFG